MEKIIRGVERFQEEVFPKERALFEELALGQHPRALMITCADSRIDPNHITQTLPGELFFLRNAGNIVPAYTAFQGAEAATIEYAMSVLGLKHNIVCGHTDCGAMKGLLDPASIAHLPAVSGWLRHSSCACEVVKTRFGHEPAEIQLRHLIEENVVSQLVNLQTHPSVAARLASGHLHLYGWIYEIGTGHVMTYDTAKRKFVPLHASLLQVDRPAEAIGWAPAFAD
jgi:carbonic anhydrase